MIISIIGIVLIILGNVMKKRQAAQNKVGNLPKILIVIGRILTAIPVGITVLFIISGALGQLEDEKRAEYSLVNAVINDDYDFLKQMLENGAPAN